MGAAHQLPQGCWGRAGSALPSKLKLPGSPVPPLQLLRPLPALFPAQVWKRQWLGQRHPHFIHVETEATYRGAAPEPTRGFPGERRGWKPRSWLMPNTQTAVSPHSPQGPAPGAQGECLLPLGSLPSLTTHSHPHRHISERMDRPMALSACQSSSGGKTPSKNGSSKTISCPSP